MKRHIKLLSVSMLTISLMFTACGKSEPVQEAAPAETTSEAPAETETEAPAEAMPAETEAEAPAETSDEMVFTLEELAEYNGKNGAKAYVAVNGIVYDVTNADEWSNGEHEDGVVAGIDATEVIKKSPHGEQVLAELPVVGKLAQ